MEFVCSVWISEQRPYRALQNIKRLLFINDVESVYCAVRTESLYNTQDSTLKVENRALLEEMRTMLLCDVSDVGI